jgi:hypothetical protein
MGRGMKKNGQIKGKEKERMVRKGKRNRRLGQREVI